MLYQVSATLRELYSKLKLEGLESKKVLQKKIFSIQMGITPPKIPLAMSPKQILRKAKLRKRRIEKYGITSIASFFLTWNV